MNLQIIKQKIEQAVELLNEFEIDLWLIFIRESHTMPDPCIDMVVGTHVTWQSAFLINKNGDTTAIVGSLEVPNTESIGTYKNVVGYVQSVKEPLLEYMDKHKPKRIAINYSLNSNLADGLTYGMYLSLKQYLKDTPYMTSLVSSEDLIAALRGRKSESEIENMQVAINETLEIYDANTQYMKVGMTELGVANFIKSKVSSIGRELAWDEAHCPAVYTGPETAGAHSGPTDRVIEEGHILNIDYGTKFNGYCSDLQRTWYFSKSGEVEVPVEVQHGFDTIFDAISKAAEFAKPGVMGHEVDNIARSYIVSRGYEDYQHGLGHQVGRIVHDGGVGFYPLWERYGSLPMKRIEKNQVFTIEPRLLVKGYGVVTIEEMIVITESGCRFLSNRQKELWVIKS